MAENIIWKMSLLIEERKRQTLTTFSMTYDTIAIPVYQHTHKDFNIRDYNINNFFELSLHFFPLVRE